MNIMIGFARNQHLRCSLCVRLQVSVKIIKQKSVQHSFIAEEKNHFVHVVPLIKEAPSEFKYIS